MTPPVNAAQIYMELFPEILGEDHPAKEYPIVFAICGLIAEVRAARNAIGLTYIVAQATSGTSGPITDLTTQGASK